MSKIDSLPRLLELRVVREAMPDDPVIIKTPSDASRYADELRDLDREAFATIALNTRNMAHGLNITSVGILNATLVDALSVFKAPIMLNAAAIILCHVHPSGNVTPSADDISTTRKLVEAGKLLDIKVLDHVILAPKDKFLSMREDGLLAFDT